jgi:hypothetical protein
MGITVLAGRYRSPSRFHGMMKRPGLLWRLAPATAFSPKSGSSAARTWICIERRGEEYGNRNFRVN